MAVDETLAESVRAGNPPTLRLYGWNPPCLSLGRNQPAHGHYPVDSLRHLGVDMVRRPTGGRAVLHDRELTYSVIFPDRAFGTPRAAYDLINRVLTEALIGMGASAASLDISTAAAPVPSLIPCFTDPSPGEVMLDGRKVIGSAQVRIGGVVLQHGSIMLARSPVLDSLPPEDAEKLEGAPAYLDEILGRPTDVDILIGHLVRGWELYIGKVEARALQEQELSRATLLADRYHDDSWTWRR